MNCSTLVHIVNSFNETITQLFLKSIKSTISIQLSENAFNFKAYNNFREE